MRKLTAVLLAMLLIVTTGCSKKDENNSGKPEVTPTVETTPEATKSPETTVTPEATTETESNGKVILTDDSISGTFVENTEQSPTTIVFKDDGTFTTNFNSCSAMVDLKGTYLKDGDTVSLLFPDKTSIVFIDEDQPFFFIVSEDSLKFKEEANFSCAGVDEYSPK